MLSRNSQIKKLAEYLAADRTEGRSLDAIATEIVDEFHAMLLSGITKPASPLRVGMLLKSPVDGKVRRVAWMDSDTDRVWLVSEVASYGWLGNGRAPFWDYCEEFRPKRRTEVDGKNKMLEMTDEEITEAWSNPDWAVGDAVSQGQRQHSFEVIATGPVCVLLKGAEGRLHADSNANLAKYYKRESKLGGEW